MKSEKGITLVTLVITIVLMFILTFTISVNIKPYEEQRVKTDFEQDIQNLTEEISQLYARTKWVPFLNPYTNTSMLEGIKNVNDNENYYVIDISYLDVTLNYGADFEKIKTKPATEKITDLLDVYIINEQSHTIYYPKGVTYGGRTYYCLPEVYSEIR